MAVGLLDAELPGVGGIQQVDLVEDEQPRRRVSADLLEDRVHRRNRLAPPALGLGRVHDVDDEIGEDRLLERRLERLDELMRELADEADRVGDEVAPPAVPIGARSRIERVEEPLPHADTRARQRVQQGGLARVRVSGEGDGRERGARRRARITSRLRSSRARRRRRLAIRSRASRRSVSIWVSPGPRVPIPPPKPLQVGPQAAHAREVVLELGQLDLELSLGAMGVVGEDVEDHRGAVDHGHPERRLQVPLLTGHKLVVAGDEVRVARGDLALELGELPTPEVPVRVRARADLDELTGGGNAGRAKELLQLRERITVAG